MGVTDAFSGDALVAEWEWPGQALRASLGATTTMDRGRMGSAGQQIRIAIALTALRHKPPEQSIQAYILDLHAAFPAVSPPSQPQGRPPSPTNPWRTRVLALEKQLCELQAECDNDKIELLALREAARKKQPRAPPRDDADPPLDAPVAGKKGRGKKRKADNAAATFDRPPPPPPESAPLQQSRLESGAILRGALAGVRTTPRVSSALDAFDMLADVLDADPHSVPAGLLRATAVRALQALETALELTFSRCGTGSPPLRSGSGSGAGSDHGGPTVALDVLGLVVHRLIWTVIPALFAQHALSASTSRVNGEKTSALDRSRASQAQAAVVEAIDDILGGLYALVLSPLVQAFATLSTPYVSACLGPRSTVLSGTGPRTISSTAVASPVGHPHDLRPAVFALLDSSLSALERILHGSSSEQPFSLSEPEPHPQPLPGDDGSSTKHGHNTAIPGVAHVKRLLALDCVRELERLYAPSASIPGPTSTRSGRARISTHASSTPPRGLPLPQSGSAQNCPGPSSITASRTARPGTSPAHARARSPRPRRPVLLPPATRPGLGNGTPRAAGNLGETRGGQSSGFHACLARGPVGSVTVPGSAGSGSDAADVAVALVGVGVGVGEGGRDGESRYCVRQGPEAGVPSGSSRANEEEGGEGRRSGDDDMRADLGRERMTKLAGKDAVWYLCAVLHRLLPLTAISPSSGSGSVSGSDSGSGSTRTAPGSAATPPAAPAPNTDEPLTKSAPHPAAAQTKSYVPDKEPPPPSSADSVGAMAERAVYDALADLLRRTRRTRRPPFPPDAAGAFEFASSPRASRVRSRRASNHGSSAANIDDDDDDPGSPTREPCGAADVDAGAVAQAQARPEGEGEIGEDLRAHACGLAAGTRTSTGTGTGTTAVMSAVERGMVLAVLERAWLGV